MCELNHCSFRVTDEMQKLRDWLDAHNIEWEDKSDAECEAWVCRTHFWYNDYKWSVIHGYGTYGGFSPYAKDIGALELLTNAVGGGEPVGYLSAQNVIEYLLEMGGER